MENGSDAGDRLRAVLNAINRPIAVAVSGGIDSLTLSAFAHRLVPDRVTMFHAVSPAVPGEATARTERLGAARGWLLKVIDAGEFADADYMANPVNRCFFCKKSLYGAIASHTDAQIVSGANLDDLGEYRPGLDAARNRGVRHPFLEAKIGKAAVRGLARSIGLGDLAELPAAPCLSSRVETGIPIRADMLKAVHAVERRIAQRFPQGIIRCRVRARGVVIELDPVTLAALEPTYVDEARAMVAELMDQKVPATALAFAPYRNGSAFLVRGPDG
jgi:pyridinium-3,5-biscarboxylic acid mononucleotide sulfurtransferase